MLTVRNRGNEPAIVGDKYLFPGQSNRYHEHVARSAVANNPGTLSIVDEAPAPTPDIEDWTQVKGIGPQLAEALCYIGILTKEDVRYHVAMYGRDALLALPGMHDKRLNALLAFVGVE